MSTAHMSAVVDILRSLYQHTQTLEEFADNVVFREGQRANLVEQSDTNRFKTFVRGVLVCYDKELQQVPSCKQVNSLLWAKNIYTTIYNSSVMDFDFVFIEKLVMSCKL